ncbi:MAG: hypothetical protein ACTS73_02845 [Arsenophonus sp. NEOnobi-MAG3]
MGSSSASTAGGSYQLLPVTITDEFMQGGSQVISGFMDICKVDFSWHIHPLCCYTIIHEINQ